MQPPQSDTTCNRHNLAADALETMYVTIEQAVLPPPWRDVTDVILWRESGLHLVEMCSHCLSRGCIHLYQFPQIEPRWLR